MKNLVLTAASAALLPVALVIALVRVLIRRRLFASAELVIETPHTAYGHTITVPDVARRLYPNKRIIFLLFSDNRLHNSKLPLIWSNPAFVSLPLSFEVRSGNPTLRLPCIPAHKQFLHRTIMKLVRSLVQKGEIVLAPDVYKQIRIPPLDIDPDEVPFNYVWPIGYFGLTRETEASRLRLPGNVRASVESRLDELVPHAGRVKRCNLYLRRKGKDGDDYHNSRRCGSPLPDYFTAVRFLNVSGYQVLVTGDVPLPDTVTREFGGMLTDARIARLNKELFDLYAATEADIFVGDPGGGVWLPGINRIPRLLVNAFPYFFGLPGSWVNYKTLRDSEGCLVPYRRLFTEFARDYELTGHRLYDNSETEILKAVEEFVADLQHPENPDPGRTILSSVPDFIWAKHAGTRICRAWLELFDSVPKPNPSPKLEVH